MSTRTKAVVHRVSVMLADEQPVQLVTTHIPWTIAKGTGLMMADPGNPQGIYGVLETTGHTMGPVARRGVGPDADPD